MPKRFSKKFVFYLFAAALYLAPARHAIAAESEAQKEPFCDKGFYMRFAMDIKS